MAGVADPVEPRIFNTGERAGHDTRFHLLNATRQADERGFKDILIVDADAHHLNEMTHYREIMKYVEDDVLRHEIENGERGGLMYPGFRSPQRHSLSGRILRYRNEHLETFEDKALHPEAEFSLREMKAIGIDYQVVFPTALLALGMHPDPFIETQLAWAYSRWLTEEVLPGSPYLKTMIYLPMPRSASPPLSVMRGDRVILRDETAQRTVGGGRVIMPAAPIHKRTDPALLHTLETFDQGRSAGAALVAALAEASGGFTQSGLVLWRSS